MLAPGKCRQAASLDEVVIGPVSALKFAGRSMLADAHAGATPAATPLLECRGVDVCVGSRTLVRGLNLLVRSGTLLAVLGPNGSGKSLSCTPLPACARRRPGELMISGRPLRHWPRRTLARELALLPQNVEDPFPASVMETVLLGRHPHIPRWQWESARDLAIASEALIAVGTRRIRRARRADFIGRRAAPRGLGSRAGANTRAFSYWTNRPTNSIRTTNWKHCSCCASRADAGAVIVTLHDPNLAGRFADDALLIGKHGDWQCGPVADILTAAHLSALYDTRFETGGNRRPPGVLPGLTAPVARAAPSNSIRAPRESPHAGGRWSPAPRWTAG
jgi:iron complex transport system ATP-binding protein